MCKNCYRLSLPAGQGRGSARNMKKRKLAVFEDQETWFLFVATQQCGIAQAGKRDKTANR